MNGKQALQFSSSGPDDAPVIVFIHGWPDDETMWRHQVEILNDRFRCIVPTLPNFGETAPETGGCDFPEIVDRLHALIDSLGQATVTLMTHDWGAYIGYLYEQQHPDNVERMIAMDVGGHFEPATARDVLMFVGYQWTLILLWLIGGVIPPLGTALTRSFAGALKVPERQVSRLASRNNYPYFYFWRSNLVPWLRSRLLGAYRPKCRVLFLYGGRKPLMFHTQRWLDIVEQAGGTNVEIERGQHWFMEEQIEETNAAVAAWLDAPRQESAA